MFGPSLNRRRFMASSAAFLAAHGLAAAEDDLPNPAETAAISASPRILSLTLLSVASVAELKAFYHGLLGLEVVEAGSERLTIAAGATRLTFVVDANSAERPFYHFAFNIPENKIASAWSWQKARSPLLPIPERLRDSNFPDEVVDYRHWNAHSIFFLDPAGNVVEYIARHGLKNAAAGAFGPADILYASEIGLVVDDVPATVSQFKQAIGLEPYIGTGDQFTAMGDEGGLVLVIKRGRILNFNPASDEKAARVYSTKVSLRGQSTSTCQVPMFPYEITMLPTS